ncbi:hypothetical protein [Nocardia sp. NPDC049149]
MLEDLTYRHVTTVYAGQMLEVEQPFPIAFDPADLLDVDKDWL